jgi:hypothetical protein
MSLKYKSILYMRTLVINKSNVVVGSNNTEYEYAFPQGGIRLEQGEKVALSSITMFYSTPNITSLYNNNKFQYLWVDGFTYDVNIPDGFYEVSNINDFLHQTFINNKHYLVETATGNFVYFLTLVANNVTYKIDLTAFPINTTLYPGATYNLPAGATWVVPVGSAVNPQLNILGAYTFGSVIGFANPIANNLYPAVNNITTTTIVSSTITPQVSPLSTFTLKCSLVNNNYTIPNSIIYSFPPFGTFGSQFSVTPPEFSFIDVNAGSYANFRVSLTDQEDKPIVILDPDITILLVIKAKDE